jgi:putative transcriptional regulator
MGYRIKEFREKIGMSQTTLAKRAGVSRGIIWMLESDTNNVTTTKTLKKIADALGTTVSDIFFEENVQSAEQKR